MPSSACAAKPRSRAAGRTRASAPPLFLRSSPHQLLIQLFDALLQLRNLRLRVGAEALALAAESCDLVVFLAIAARVLRHLRAQVVDVVAQTFELVVFVRQTLPPLRLLLFVQALD